MPCNVCWSCRQCVHLFMAVIPPGARCKAWPGVRLCPHGVTTWETPWRWLILCSQWRGRKNNRTSDISWSLLWFHLFWLKGSLQQSVGWRVKRSSEHCALVTSTPSPWSSSWLHLGWVGTAPREAEIPSPSQKGPSGLLPCLEQKEWEGERNRRSYVGSILLEKPPGCIFYPGKKYFFSNRQVNSFCQNTSL